ncbi:MAG: hypothetical protein R2715_01315 [Ilumatobacteraceae bacterium]
MGTGYSFVLDTSDNAPVTSEDTFAIAQSGFTNVRFEELVPVTGWRSQSVNEWNDAWRFFWDWDHIRWDSLGAIGTVRIELVSTDGNTTIVLADGRVNDGAWITDFRNLDATDSDYTFRIVPSNPAAAPFEHAIHFWYDSYTDISPISTTTPIRGSAEGWVTPGCRRRMAAT